MSKSFFIAGNWKMNILPSEVIHIAGEMVKCSLKYPQVRVAICTPFIDIPILKENITGSKIHLGAQNVHPQQSGAYTGEVSPTMLRDMGVEVCIVGHSERRQFFNETDEFINAKVKSLITVGIEPILCIGETLEERQAGQTSEIIHNQLSSSLNNILESDIKNITIAYEPVWAIGTGETATPEQAQEVHQSIREFLIDKFGETLANNVWILYGGSVTPDNVRELLKEKDIDGTLLGGASLNPDLRWKCHTR